MPSMLPSSSVAKIMQTLENQGSSYLASHGEACCIKAQAWFNAMAAAYSASTAMSQPAWLRDKWRWGPTKWPLYWCEAMVNDELDCGAFAALAEIALACQGTACMRAQFIEAFDIAAGQNWEAHWRQASVDVQWVWDDLVYHEAVAIIDGDNAKLWDPTDVCFVDDKASSGYAALKAIRLIYDGKDDSRKRVICRGRWIDAGVWTQL